MIIMAELLHYKCLLPIYLITKLSIYATYVFKVSSQIFHEIPCEPLEHFMVSSAEEDSKQR